MAKCPFSIHFSVNSQTAWYSQCHSEAECDRARLDVRYAADTQIANSTRDYQLQKASFDQEINTARAEAELAYKLQAAKEQQKIRTEEVNITIVERRKQIEVEEKEILCSEKKMDATVRRPAEAEAYRLQQVAEGNRLTLIGLQLIIAPASVIRNRRYSLSLCGRYACCTL
ncbi:hypothetical protein X801_08176 [Opisthorchis viverrini]|uniref:Uncharacterized protein n=1 Tax=Opisthorchis viverrini TaxID=6198 RepID=A0A1S8WNP1_OPIVI|nr:hypothetical protein X801_08176 [Opisthorchis viverrini]